MATALVVSIAVASEQTSLLEPPRVEQAIKIEEVDHFPTTVWGWFDYGLGVIAGAYGPLN